MLSASFNQNSNQDLRFNLSDQMNDLTSNFSYDNYNSKSELFNQYFNPNQFVGNINQDSKIYSITEVDNLMHSNGVNSQMEYNPDFDLGLLSTRLQSMGIKSNCNLSRSNSAHNSPFDSRITPRIFSQSTSNTPVPILNRLSRDIDPMRGNPPIMQLFPGNNVTTNPTTQMNSYNINRQSPIELIEYQSIASKMGFLVGQDLEEVLNRSATMKNSNSSRISNFFKHKHGSSGAHSAVKQYLVLGVRVPSKEHVSEIVGKEGKKIKMIRQTTGALIATPNEKEDHVFLIEAVPETALKVGQIIQQLADQISRNKLGTLAGVGGERPRSPPVLGNRTPLATATIGVPQRLVGKVIGTQGSIITTVQKETGTEIKSPPKDELRAPDDNADFEISVYENGTVNSEETAWLQIHRAKQLIAHLVMRVWDSQPRNSTPSSDEGLGCASQYASTPEWIWPEVARMDDGDAKEIVDRILRSSKAKITPSTSSAEGIVTVDGTQAMTTIQGMSPPYQHQSMHTTPYKMFQSRSIDDDNVNNNSNWIPNRLDQSNYQYADSRSSFYNDSAFYDNYYYDNGYQADHNGYQNNHDMSSHNINDTPSWMKSLSYTSGSNAVCGNNNYSDEARFGSLKYLWKNELNEPTEMRQPIVHSHNNNNNNNSHYYHNPNHHQQTSGNTRSMMPSLESMYGTIGDGRKRYSAASNNSDDREDL